MDKRRSDQHKSKRTRKQTGVSPLPKTQSSNCSRRRQSEPLSLSEDLDSLSQKLDQIHRNQQIKELLKGLSARRTSAESSKDTSFSSHQEDDLQSQLQGDDQQCSIDRDSINAEDKSTLSVLSRKNKYTGLVQDLAVRLRTMGAEASKHEEDGSSSMQAHNNDTLGAVVPSPKQSPTRHKAKKRSTGSHRSRRLSSPESLNSIVQSDLLEDASGQLLRRSQPIDEDESPRHAAATTGSATPPAARDEEEADLVASASRDVQISSPISDPVEPRDAQQAEETKRQGRRKSGSRRRRRHDETSPSKRRSEKTAGDSPLATESESGMASPNLMEESPEYMLGWQSDHARSLSEKYMDARQHEEDSLPSEAPVEVVWEEGLEAPLAVEVTSQPESPLAARRSGSRRRRRGSPSVQVSTGIDAHTLMTEESPENGSPIAQAVHRTHQRAVYKPWNDDRSPLLSPTQRSTPSPSDDEDEELYSLPAPSIWKPHDGDDKDESHYESTHEAEHDVSTPQEEIESDSANAPTKSDEQQQQQPHPEATGTAQNDNTGHPTPQHPLLESVTQSPALTALAMVGLITDDTARALSRSTSRLSQEANDDENDGVDSQHAAQHADNDTETSTTELPPTQDGAVDRDSVSTPPLGENSQRDKADDQGLPSKLAENEGSLEDRDKIEDCDGRKEPERDDTGQSSAVGDERSETKTEAPNKMSSDSPSDGHLSEDFSTSVIESLSDFASTNGVTEATGAMTEHPFDRKSRGSSLLDESDGHRVVAAGMDIPSLKASLEDSTEDMRTAASLSSSPGQTGTTVGAPTSQTAKDGVETSYQDATEAEGRESLQECVSKDRSALENPLLVDAGNEEGSVPSDVGAPSAPESVEHGAAAAAAAENALVRVDGSTPITSEMLDQSVVAPVLEGEGLESLLPPPIQSSDAKGNDSVVDEHFAASSPEANTHSSSKSVSDLLDQPNLLLDDSEGVMFCMDVSTPRASEILDQSAIAPLLADEDLLSRPPTPEADSKSSQVNESEAVEAFTQAGTITDETARVLVQATASPTMEGGDQNGEASHAVNKSKAVEALAETGMITDETATLLIPATDALTTKGDEQSGDDSSTVNESKAVEALTETGMITDETATLLVQATDALTTKGDEQSGDDCLAETGRITDETATLIAQATDALTTEGDVQSGEAFPAVDESEPIEALENAGMITDETMAVLSGEDSCAPGGIEAVEALARAGMITAETATVLAIKGNDQIGDNNSCAVNESQTVQALTKTTDETAAVLVQASAALAFKGNDQPGDDAPTESPTDESIVPPGNKSAGLPQPKDESVEDITSESLPPDTDLAPACPPLAPARDDTGKIDAAGMANESLTKSESAVDLSTVDSWKRVVDQAKRRMSNCAVEKESTEVKPQDEALELPETSTCSASNQSDAAIQSQEGITGDESGERALIQAAHKEAIKTQPLQRGADNTDTSTEEPFPSEVEPSERETLSSPEPGPCSVITDPPCSIESKEGDSCNQDAIEASTTNTDALGGEIVSEPTKASTTVNTPGGAVATETEKTTCEPQTTAGFLQSSGGVECGVDGQVKPSQADASQERTDAAESHLHASSSWSHMAKKEVVSTVDPVVATAVSVGETVSSAVADTNQAIARDTKTTREEADTETKSLSGKVLQPKEETTLGDSIVAAASSVLVGDFPDFHSEDSTKPQSLASNEAKLPARTRCSNESPESRVVEKVNSAAREILSPNHPETSPQGSNEVARLGESSRDQSALKTMLSLSESTASTGAPSSQVLGKKKEDVSTRSSANTSPSSDSEGSSIVPRVHEQPSSPSDNVSLAESSITEASHPASCDFRVKPVFSPKASVFRRQNSSPSDLMNYKPRSVRDLLKKDLRSSDEAIVERALQQITIDCFYDQSARSLIARSGGLLSIIATMEDFAENPRIQIAACQALEKLALDAENERAVLELGGIDCILGAMMGHFNNLRVQESAWSALQNLTCSNALGEMTFDTTDGGMMVLVDAFQQHSSHSGIAQHAAATIANLCIPNEGRTEQVIAANGVVHLAKALECHWADENARVEISQSLERLCESIASRFTSGP